MIRKLVSLSAVSLLALACSKPAAMHPQVEPSEVKATDVRESMPNGVDSDTDGDKADGLLRVSLPAGEVVPGAAGEVHMRSVGDFVAYRFSGSYREQSVVVSQRVEARTAENLTIVMTVDSGGEVLRLRLIFDERADTRGEVLSAFKLEGAKQRPYGVAVYEQLMSEIMLSADANEAQLSTQNTKVEVGNRVFAAQRIRYRVRVGAHQAVMETLSAPQFAWGDIGGSIQTLDGKLLYKAEVIDAGGSGFKAPQIAVQAPEEDDSDYVDFE